MSATTNRDPAGPEGLEALFKMGRRRPTYAILLLLAVMALTGIVAGTVVNEAGEIPAHIPTRNTDERLSLPAGGFPGLAVQALQQIDQPIERPPVPDTEDNVILGPDQASIIDVPPDWNILSEDPDGAFAFFRGPSGATFGAELVNVDAQTPASDVLIQAVDDVLATERYTQRNLSVLQTRIPFGRLVSWAVTGYSAIRTDPQGAQSVGGNLWVFVREDGLALILNAEVTPVGDWEQGIEVWEPLLLTAAESFARQEFP